MHLVNGTGNQPVSGTADPEVVSRPWGFMDACLTFLMHREWLGRRVWGAVETHDGVCSSTAPQTSGGVQANVCRVVSTADSAWTLVPVGHRFWDAVCLVSHCRLVHV